MNFRSETLAPRQRGKLSKWSQDLVYTVLGMTLIVLLTAGCGGGGNSSPAPQDSSGTTPAPETGSLVVTLTDAPGDFVMYAVTIDAMTLIRANGDEVDVLPLQTRVDFVELTEVTELLNIATVPVGTYKSVSMQLDFTDAEIWVQDELGNAIQAQPQDIDGNPLLTQATELQLTTSDVINIRPGVPAAFSLDFDLDASNTIDLSTAVPVVTVEPLLLATPELEQDREHRVRGLLAEVGEASFVLQVRPFRQRQGQFGEFTIQVDDETLYEIDGVTFSGAEGLTAMNELAADAPVVTAGAVTQDESSIAYVASQVRAGSSVPWADADVLAGVVVARQGNEIAVRGATLEFADGRRAYRGEFVLLLDEDTVVSSLYAGESTLDINSISVGQRVRAWGVQADDMTLQADRVQLPLSQFTALVVEPAPLQVDLYWLNGRRPAIYDFTGTGIAPEDDALESLYEVDTGLLNIDNLQAGDLTRVRGLVNDFGQAPADFNARTVIDLQTDARAASLKVLWPERSTSPFVAISDSQIDVDLSSSEEVLKVRGVPRDFIALMDQVGLAAPDNGNGVYTIRVRGSGMAEVYRSFADLSAALVAQLDAGAQLHRTSAQGRYNVAAQTLTLARAGFVFTSGDEGS